MKKLYICVGAPGVGKSTYIKSKMNNNSIHLSSDNIRMKLFNTLLEQSQDAHKIVFDNMRNELINALEDKNITEIYYDATNLNRKRRIALYNLCKQTNKGTEVICLVFLKPLKTILQQNSQRTRFYRVPDEVIAEKYKQLQIPRLNVDCDKIERAFGVNINEFSEEYSKDTEHNSSFHKETVWEHINMCIKNADTIELKKIAFFHDLGKFICKTFINDEVAHFKQHNQVSAMYFLAFMDLENEVDLSILEVIFQHMAKLQGLGNKLIKRNKLTDFELQLLNDFAKIDDKSRVVNKTRNL